MEKAAPHDWLLLCTLTSLLTYTHLPTYTLMFNSILEYFLTEVGIFGIADQVKFFKNHS
jgi:hypothetical protein